MGKEMSELLFLGEDFILNLALKSSIEQTCPCNSFFLLAISVTSDIPLSHILRKVETDELFYFFGVNFLLCKISKKEFIFINLIFTKKDVKKIKELIKMNKKYHV